MYKKLHSPAQNDYSLFFGLLLLFILVSLKQHDANAETMEHSLQGVWKGTLDKAPITFCYPAYDPTFHKGMVSFGGDGNPELLDLDDENHDTEVGLKQEFIFNEWLPPPNDGGEYEVGFWTLKMTNKDHLDGFWSADRESPKSIQLERVVSSHEGCRDKSFLDGVRFPQFYFTKLTILGGMPYQLFYYDNYPKKDYEITLKLLQPLAEHGDAIAQNYLGNVYLTQVSINNVQGVSEKVANQYSENAKKWFTLAAHQGNIEAQNSLCSLYEDVGDKPQAAQCYLTAAKQGNMIAEANLGRYYLGLAIDTEKPQPEFFPQAVQWTQKAADQGYAEAQVNLAQMYHEGWGVKKDYKIAMDWYRKAANQGNYDSFGSMGEMYKAGQGVAASRVIADALTRLSDRYDRSNPANSGSTQPLSEDEELRPLEEKMSSQEIETAKNLTDKMEKSHNILSELDKYIMHPTAKEDPMYFPAGGKTSLCTDSEQVLLSCVTKTKLISLCASKSFSSTTGYIQYRVEKNGTMEFEFPKEKEQPGKVFTFSQSRGTIGGSESLEFKNGKYLYNIQHDFDKYNLDDYSVFVTRNQKPVSNLLCLEKENSDHWGDISRVNLPN